MRSRFSRSVGVAVSLVISSVVLAACGGTSAPRAHAWAGWSAARITEEMASVSRRAPAVAVTLHSGDVDLVVQHNRNGAYSFTVTHGSSTLSVRHLVAHGSTAAVTYVSANEVQLTTPLHAATDVPALSTRACWPHLTTLRARAIANTWWTTTQLRASWSTASACASVLAAWPSTTLQALYHEGTKLSKGPTEMWHGQHVQLLYAPGAVLYVSNSSTPHPVGVTETSFTANVPALYVTMQWPTQAFVFTKPTTP